MRAKPRPFLVVTDDGRRPWHQEFRVRDLGDRRIAYWWGTFGPRRRFVLGETPDCRLNRIERVVRRTRAKPVRNLQRYVILAGCYEALYVPSLYFQIVTGASPHPGPCSTDGYIGIAWLPDPPDCWRPGAVWPGWKHLAHYFPAGDESWDMPVSEKRMVQMWARLEGATDDELRELLGHDADMDNDGRGRV